MNIKILAAGAKIPVRGSKHSAGLDLKAYIPEGMIIIKPGETEVIQTGIAVEIPAGYFGGIYARSGLATKRGLRPSNCVGVIDSDYRGEVKVALYNDSETVQIVYDGDRIAQLIVQAYAPVKVNVVDELSNTERGAGGFGSTGRR